MHDKNINQTSQTLLVALLFSGKEPHYETNVRPKIGRTVISTQNLELINMDVIGGYDQISHQVWARVRKFWVSLNLRAA